MRYVSAVARRKNTIQTLVKMSLTIFFFLSCNSALACFGMPQRLIRPHAEVVAEAKQIFLAEVVRVQPTKHMVNARKPVRYTLKVIQVLKGTVSPSFQLYGEGDLSGIWDTTFSNHADNKFWKDAAGRMGMNGDCSMVPAHFLIGKRYLIFISPAEDTKQFERVDSKDDRWLRYVEEKTGRTP